jgi:hypothetical protein
MLTIAWLISVLLLGLLIHSLVIPFVKGINYTEIEAPKVIIEEKKAVVEEAAKVEDKPAPKKKRTYKKRKPKNDKGEK